MYADPTLKSGRASCVRFFFACSLRLGQGPCNQIAAALVARIARAVHNKERFRVVVVVPIVPSLASADDLKTRIITKL